MDARSLRRLENLAEELENFVATSVESQAKRTAAADARALRLALHFIRAQKAKRP